jgi:AcrR family transcriptional regulator
VERATSSTTPDVMPSRARLHRPADAALDRARRTEILDTAAELFASSGLRTSLKEIADASGILPGSLYHHFDSKEAIIVELIDRYRAELDRLAHDTHTALAHTPDDGIPARIVELGRAIAACAQRNRAALLLTFYEPPSGAGEDLVRVAQHTRTAIEQATVETFRAGQAGGYLRHDLDVGRLAARFCEVMLHLSLGVLRDLPGAGDMPRIRSRVLLDGIATGQPSDAALDRSGAMAAAGTVIESWEKGETDEAERFALLRAVARTEFGRRGYEATTIRDIASAAGLSTGSVYRMIGSKEELLDTVVRSFVTTVRTAWAPVLRSDASPVEKLDALMWININVVDRFSDEFNIQLAWFRESPPSTSNLGASFTARLRDVQSLLAAGRRSGELHVDGPSAAVRAWSLFELLWVPEGIVHDAGPRAALAFSRDTILRGAVRR